MYYALIQLRLYLKMGPAKTIATKSGEGLHQT